MFLLSVTFLFFICMGFNAIISTFKPFLPGCHNQYFPQIFASNWQLSHLVSGRRQVTSQLSIIHSRPDGPKKEGRTDNGKTISPSKSSAGDNKIWKSITKKCVWTESLSVYYVYLKVTLVHNSISSWCSATKLGVSRNQDYFFQTGRLSKT